jgi:hypoxanthine-DNA glycosylase
MTQCLGFGPVADDRSRVLILGSMPGVASLEKHQYYGHPRNAFWPIMGELFGARPEIDYPLRLQRLLDRHVALWDVLMSCHRPGSLDADIRSGTEQVNDFSELLGSDTPVRAIFFNGMTAEKMFNQHVIHTLDGLSERCDLVRLPSTSPAHAAMTFDAKLKAWQVVADYAG